MSGERSKGPDLAMLILGVAVAALMVLRALRDDPAAPPIDAAVVAVLAHYDGDGDGMIAMDEFPGGDPLFRRLDADADGNLGAEDLLPDSSDGLPPVRRGSRFIESFDSDGDGFLDKAEFAGTRKAFMRTDIDGNGLLSPEEALFRPSRKGAGNADL